VFDVRFLPNPNWVDALKDLTGRDPAVRDYVLGHKEGADFAARLDELLGFLLPNYAREGRSYLSVAIGCTGGRHRSVVLAEEVARRIRDRGYEPAVYHRDIDR
jgi:UPF0042 nucleotide-binding protein